MKKSCQNAVLTIATFAALSMITQSAFASENCAEGTVAGSLIGGTLGAITGEAIDGKAGAGALIGGTLGAIIGCSEGEKNQARRRTERDYERNYDGDEPIIYRERPVRRQRIIRTRTVTAFANVRCLRQAMREIRFTPKAVKKAIFHCNAGRHAGLARARKNGFECDSGFVTAAQQPDNFSRSNITRRLFNHAGGQHDVRRWCRRASGVSMNRCMGWFRKAAWDIQYTCEKVTRRTVY